MMALLFGGRSHLRARQYFVGSLRALGERGELGSIRLRGEASLCEQRPVWKSKFVGSRPCVAYY
jgi:hypothetical protein